MQSNRYVIPIKQSKQTHNNVTAVILASIPNHGMKTMPPVCSMTIDKQHTVLDLQIEAINIAYPNSEIILVVGHGAQELINNRPIGVRIVENSKYDELGEIEELRLALNNVTTDNVLLVNGNLIFNANAISNLKGHSSCVLVDNNSQISDESLGVISNNSMLENIAYGVANKWCYVSYLENHEHLILRKFCNVRTRGRMCLFEGINYITSHNGLIYTVKQNNGYLRKIESNKDIK